VIRSKGEDMELVTTFESLSKRVLEKYDENVPITMGILVADYRQSDAREYIINYLNRFDEKSGKYIDFYLPGYYMYSEEDQNEWEIRSHRNVCISKHRSSREPIFITRLNERFYFDEYLFEEFLRQFEKETDISYTYSPMLILVEINKKKGYGELEFQDKMVIDLDDGTPRGVRRSGVLFEEIFNIAKCEVGLDRFAREMRMHYLRGNAIKSIATILDGNIIEPLVENMKGIMQYRIKKI